MVFIYLLKLLIKIPGPHVKSEYSILCIFFYAHLIYRQMLNINYQTYDCKQGSAQDFIFVGFLYFIYVIEGPKGGTGVSTPGNCEYLNVKWCILLHSEQQMSLFHFTNFTPSFMRFYVALFNNYTPSISDKT